MPLLLALAVLLLLLARGSGRWPEPRSSNPKREGSLPKVAIVAPMAGPVAHLESFLAALDDQDYPDYRVILVIEKAREATGDPDEAYNRVTALERAGLPPRTAVVRAERAVSSGQKSLNLIAGLTASGDAEVVVLVDADALPHRRWLRDLVAPLSAGDSVDHPMVTTGYRWYVPDHGLASLMRSAFSAGAMSLLTDPRRAFAWGGSLAIRRRDLERLGIAGIWRRALSDDMALTRAVRAAGGRVCFIPECVVPSFGAVGWRGMWEFGVRQMVMLRWGDRRLWATVLAMHVGLVVTQIGAVLAALGLGTFPGGFLGRAAAVAILAAPSLLGVARARSRIHELSRRPLAQVAGWDGRRGAHLALAPVIAWLTLACLVAAGFRRELSWCGIRYRLRARGAVEVASGPDPAAV